jgi:hypothetical protein
MQDRYFNNQECIDRLFNDYKQHGNLFVAFDFDDTVFDFHNKGDYFSKMESLLRELYDRKFTLILFTGNEGDKLDAAVNYCVERGYKPTYVNENPIMATRKPYYNILFDDRSSLSEAYCIMNSVLNKIDLAEEFNKNVLI